MKKYIYNKLRKYTAVGKIVMILLNLIILFMGLWVAISFFEFMLENTHYVTGHINKYNIVVVIYSICDNILQGFIF